MYSILGILYILDRKKVSICFSKNRVKKCYSSKIYIIFFSLILILISSMRSYTVGIDTQSYLWRFSNQKFLYSDLYSLINENEFGFSLVMQFFSITDFGFRGLLIFSSIVAIVPVSMYIYRYSVNPFASFFFYITLDYYFFSMTGIRQSMAIGMCLIALLFIEKNKVFSFFMIILACTIHKTAMVFFGIMFLQFNSKPNIIKIVLIGIALYFSKSFIQPFIRTFARIDYASLDTGGYGFYILMLTVTFIYLLIVSKETKRINLNINMLLIAIWLYPILQYNPSVLRLSYYYSIPLIILIPNIISILKSLTIRYLVAFFYIAIALYYYIYYTSRTMGVLPYSVL